ncbi:hypothetical protein SAMN05660668_02717 [Pseudobutyrivibrio sp. AR14]|uniref:hypothetical protein n=1 Tax=Pseudobutyrivibrio sp. AR14 TaxID=1520804 RepID=UPI00089088FA|nr:hypothetical protein [Pseudobutyrivibrio sp. AR14]SCY45928.1 hypothetical protein SAMN05660668_02717 [Pseudobutyrivibrio sp. AR14]
MIEKYIEKTKSQSIKNWWVSIITILAFAAICLCEKCTISLHLGIRSIVENIAISILAAGIYYLFSEVIYAKRMKRKMAGIVNEYYRNFAEDLKDLFWAITGEKEWYKDSKPTTGMNKSGWYDEKLLAFVESEGEQYCCTNRIGLLSLAITNIELSIANIEGILEWCDAKEVKYVFDFYNSFLYKRLRLMKNLPEDEPVDFENSLSGNKLQEVESLMKIKENQSLTQDLSKFVSKYYHVK